MTTGHSKRSAGDGSFVLALVGARTSAFPAFGADVFEAARALLAIASLFRIEEPAGLILLALAVLILLALVAFTPFTASLSALTSLATTATTAATAPTALVIPDAFGDFLLDEVVDLAFGKGGRNGAGNGNRSLHVVRHLDVHKLDRHLNCLTQLLSRTHIFHPFATDRHVSLLGLLKWDLKARFRMNHMLSNVTPIYVKLMGRHPRAVRIELKSSEVFGDQIELEAPQPAFVIEVVRLA